MAQRLIMLQCRGPMFNLWSGTRSHMVPVTSLSAHRSELKKTPRAAVKDNDSACCSKDVVQPNK